MISQKELKELLEYNSKTGTFTWLSGYRKGQLAGSTSGKYRVITLHAKQYRSDKLAFLYMTGQIPKYVSHINENDHDDTWDNLQPRSSRPTPKARQVYVEPFSDISLIDKAARLWIVRNYA